MPSHIGSSASALIPVVLLYFWLTSRGTLQTITTYFLLGAICGYTMSRGLGFSNRLAALTILPLTTLATVEARPTLRYGFNDLPAGHLTRSDTSHTVVHSVEAQLHRHEEGLYSRRDALQHAKIEVILKSERHHTEKYAILERKYMASLAEAKEEKSRADALQVRCDRAETEIHGLPKNIALAGTAHAERQSALEDRCHLLETTNEGLKANLELSGRDFMTIQSAYQKFEAAYESAVINAAEVSQNYATLQSAYEKLQNEYHSVAETASKNSRWLEALREDAQEGHVLIRQMEEAAVEELPEDNESQASPRTQDRWLTWGELCAKGGMSIPEPTPIPSTDVNQTTTPDEAIPDILSSSPPDAAHEWDQDLVPDSLFNKYLADSKQNYPEVTDWSIHGAICVEVGYDHAGNRSYFRCVP